MKITMLQAIEASKSLQRMSDERIKLSPISGLKLSRLKRLLAPEAATYQEAELALVEEYADRDDKGKIQWGERGGFQIQPGVVPEFTKKHTEIGLVEIDVEWEPLSLVGEEIKLDIEQIDALTGFVKFE